MTCRDVCLPIDQFRTSIAHDLNGKKRFSLAHRAKTATVGVRRDNRSMRMESLNVGYQADRRDEWSAKGGRPLTESTRGKAAYDFPAGCAVLATQVES